MVTAGDEIDEEATPSSPLLQLRVRSADGKHTVSIRARGSVSMYELKDIIVENFDKIDTSIVAKEFDLLWGFPPKKSNDLSPLELQTRPIDSFMGSNETLRLQLHESDRMQKVAAPAKKKARASRGMSGGGSSAVRTSSATPLGARISTLAGKYTNLQKGEGKRKRGGSSSKAGKKVKGAVEGSTDNISGDKFIDLANVVINGMKGGSSHDKQLRGVFKFAVEMQYSRTQALARVSAANSSAFELRELPGHRVLGSGDSCMIEVSYPKGHGSRQR